MKFEHGDYSFQVDKRGVERFRKDGKLAKKEEVPNDVKQILYDMAKTTVAQEEVQQEAAGPTQEIPQEGIIQLITQLKQEIEELKRNNPQAEAATADQKLQEMLRVYGQSQATVGNSGVQGIVQKYPIETQHYPNPIERLYDLPELKRFSMRENYIITYEVNGVTYEKNNVTYSEPRFILHLYRRLYDDDGNDSGRVALVNRHMQHEDELVTKLAAQKLGLDIGRWDEVVDEVRFLRMQQWILDLFRPIKANTKNKHKTVELIDGKAVEVYDTEAVIDGESGIAKANAVQGQAGVGKVRI